MEISVQANILNSIKYIVYKTSQFFLANPMAQGSHHHGPGVHVEQGQGVVHDDGV